MKKVAFLIVLFTLSYISKAQIFIKGGNKTAIGYDKKLSGGNYTSYFNVYKFLTEQGLTKQTPAPEGYEPFYISTYARHGSRYLTDPDSYDSPIKILKQAEAKGILTEEGKKLLKDLTDLRALCPNSMIGVLTEIGVAQHRDIAKRMVSNFPEIFDGKGSYYAQSSVVKRCIKSMNAEVGVIDSLTNSHVIQAYGKAGMQDRLAGKYTNSTIDSWRSKGYSYHSKERAELTPYRRFCSQFFTSDSWTTTKTMQSFSRLIFDLAENMQSHNFGYDFYKYFTNEECDSILIIKNRHWYRMFGPSMTTGGLMPQLAKHQFEDIIQGVDSAVTKKNWHGANLRFGHDTQLMPLACLLELGTCGKHIDENSLNSLGDIWRSQEIFPMAGNIQLIFYRPKNGEGEILIKAMLCEMEVTLPGTPVSGPYYRWSEIESHWKSKMN